MAVTPPTEGFFSSTGTLLTPTRPSASASQSTAASTPTDTSVTNTAAATTAIATAEAAVVTITNRLNVGNTGFDNGVSDLVAKAVSAGLQNQANNSSTTSTKLLQVGGTFQNELIKNAREAASNSTPTPPPTPVVAPEIPNEEGETPVIEEPVVPETPVSTRPGRRGQGGRRQNKPEKARGKDR